MKVTLIFDNVRTVFDSVETLSFEDFMAAVAASFGLDSNSFDILLGDNAVVLDATSPITDFGIVSGDLLYVRLKTSHSSSAKKDSTTSEKRDGVVPDPTTASSSSAVGTSSQSTGASTSTAADVEMREPANSVVEIPVDKDLDAYLVANITHGMERNGFEVVSSNTESFTTPRQTRRLFMHPSTREILVQMSLDAYHDAVPPADVNRVTSVALTWMTVMPKSGTRHFHDTIYLHRDAPMFKDFLDEIIAQMCDIVIGPSNPFLRILSQDPVAKIFRHLSPADVLNVERTCRYARNSCRSSKLIDETVWRPALCQRYGLAAASVVSAPTEDKTVRPGVLVADRNPRTYREAYLRKRKRENAPCLFSALHQLPSGPAGKKRPIPAAGPAAQPSYLPVGPMPSAPGLGQPGVGYPPDAPLMQPRQPINPDINPLVPGFGHMVVPNQPQRPRHPNIDPFHPFAPDGFNPPDPDMPQGPRHPNMPQGPQYPDMQQDIFRGGPMGGGRRGGSGRFGGGGGNFPDGGFFG